MATLEKIRSKSVILFTVIIVALLAFILGDFLTSGRSFFGPGDTVASADGVDVKFDEYQKKTQELSAQFQGQNVDPDVISQMAIEQLLNEKLMKKEYDRLGITVTDQQLHDLFYGQDNGMGVLGALAQRMGTNAQALQGLGITTLAQYAEAMENPAKYKLNAEIAQAMKDAWFGLEDAAEDNLRAQAYGNLITTLYTSSNIDRQAIYNDNNERRGFSYAGKSLASIADGDVKIQDADYQKVYDKRKGQFKLNEEKRYISYIEVPVTPSEKDFAEAQQKYEKVVADLRESEGVKALTKNTDFHAGKAVKHSRGTIAKDEVLRGMLADSSALAAGSVVALPLGPNNTYRIAKVLDVTTGIDKVKYAMIMGKSADIDSIKQSLNATNFDSIANAVNAGGKLSGMAAREMSMLNMEPTADDKKMFDAITESPVGQVTFITDTLAAEKSADGKATPFTYALLVSERDLPAEVYNVTIIDGMPQPIANPDPIRLSDLKGYAVQKKAIRDNTLSLLAGKNANNILLYGDKGCGKSSTVKAIANEYADRGLKIIEMPMDQIKQFPAICSMIERSPFTFILFLDDLSFTAEDERFVALKAFIEGGVAGKPHNMAIYATSNRRHIIRENFSDRNGDDVHVRDAMQSASSLSDRFGIEITFSNPVKNEYLYIVDRLAEDYGLDLPEERLHLLAERFAIRKNGRSPRTARQFITHQLALENGDKETEEN